MMQPMVIYTAQMRVSVPDEIDITIKSASTPAGRALSPTWDMVNGFMSGAMTEKIYTQKYLSLVRHRYRYDSIKFAIWDILKNNRSITLKCYCPAETFCHRLLAKELLMKIGEYIGVEVCDGGEITQLTRSR